MSPDTNTWYKSSYSGGNGGDCLEVAWTKSSYSERGADNCVECRTAQDRVLVRDSQHPVHGHLAFPGTEWAAFLHAVRESDLDR